MFLSRTVCFWLGGALGGGGISLGKRHFLEENVVKGEWGCARFDHALLSDSPLEIYTGLRSKVRFHSRIGRFKRGEASFLMIPRGGAQRRVAEK